MTTKPVSVHRILVAAVLCAGAAPSALALPSPRVPDPAPVTAKLTEWMVQLSQSTVRSGAVTFAVTNAGSIPHQFEVEGRGLEKETALIQPGATDTLTLTLKPGTYEVYCPVGRGSHEMLGMKTHLKVVSGGAAPVHETHNMNAMTSAPVKPIRVTGGGPVIQILPGPFPFPDSAGPILKSFGEEHEALESQSVNGPYSNNVAPISGTFTVSAWEKGAVRDSVDGVAEFTTQDGAKWKLVLDRVQTQDVPHHPKFGGVIRGLYYHGNTGVHTPLVPTINSAVALWAFGHLFKDGVRVTDNAYVHVMLLSRTRSTKDFTLECWDCSRNKVEELQLQVTAAPGEPKFAAPGGFLFVNWERSTSVPAAK
ncbi:MAG TPA: cupredoxin domain-containing protein [Gemmatimonadaceae bacterium]